MVKKKKNGRHYTREKNGIHEGRRYFSLNRAISLRKLSVARPPRSLLTLPISRIHPGIIIIITLLYYIWKYKNRASNRAGIKDKCSLPIKARSEETGLQLRAIVNSTLNVTNRAPAPKIRRWIGTYPVKTGMGGKETRGGRRGRNEREEKFDISTNRENILQTPEIERLARLFGSGHAKCFRTIGH